MTMPLIPQIWMQRVCSGSIPAVLDLYSDNAVLVPTYDKSDLPGAGLGVLQGKRYVVGYFNRFMAKQALCGSIDTMVEQPMGCATVYSGTYTFRWRKNGQAKSARARYTFVVAVTPGGPKIVNQHSSVLP